MWWGYDSYVNTGLPGFLLFSFISPIRLLICLSSSPVSSTPSNMHFVNSSTYQSVKWVANCECFLGDILYFRYNFLTWLISSPDNFVSRTGSITSKETKTNALRTDLWLFAATYRLSNAGSQLVWLVTCLLIICC